SSGTSYEVYVRQVCSGPSYSANVGPASFSTQTLCPVTNATICYANNTTTWVNVYVANPGDYLDITFNSGQVESNYDELLVYTGANGTGTQLYSGYGTSGSVAGLTFQSTTGVISFAVQADGFASCGSGSQTPINYSVVCSAPPTCLPPTGLAVSSPTTSGANVGWTASTSSPGSYDYYVSTSNTNPTAGTTPTGVSVGTSVVLSGYPQATTQYVWVRANCGGGDLSSWAGPVSFVPAVENDLCANATEIQCGQTLAGTNVGATSTGQPTGSCGTAPGGPGVWYEFVGTGYPVTFSTCTPVGSLTDTKINVYTGNCGTLTCIGGNDDGGGCGLRSTYALSSTTLGQTYYVLVTGFSSSTGTFSLTASCSVDVWTGTLSTDWGTNGNWSDGSVPTASENALIPTAPSGGNFPSVAGNYSVSRLTSASNAVVNIQAGSSLTVSVALTNNGTMNVASGGSLVQTTGSALTGTGIYNITRVGSNVYDFWSSPLTSISPSFLGGTVYQFNPALGTADPADDAFDPGWVSPGGVMTPGKGFAAWGAGTKTFQGTVNNGTVNMPVTSHPLPNVSFNLVGNPYPSGIDVSSFLSANTSILQVGAIYLWDDPGTTPYVSADYAVRNALGGTAGGGGNTPGAVIGTAQGFKVEVNGNGNVVFNNGMRVAGNTSMLFREVERNLMWISVVNGENNYNQTLVGFAEDGSDGVDWAYDAPKLNYLAPLSLYSLMDGVPYAIQGYGTFDEQRIVPLGLNSESETEVLFRLDSLENFPEVEVVLEDRYLGLFHPLTQSPYSVSVADATYSDRFFIHYQPVSLVGIQDVQNEELSAFVSGDGQLFVNSSVDRIANMELLDMNGRSVWSSNQIKLFTGQNNVAHLNFATGIYLLRLEDSRNVETFKLNVR
ncbi:MAG: T9SS type A sorting domain-containing protein, partial [Bacteroidetes bacterium]